MNQNFLGEGVLGVVAKPLGMLLRFIYENVAFRDYGLAIILFTVVVKLVLLPLTVKQMKSMSKMQELQPKMQELQKKYANNKEKLNEELAKFYQENSYNPASGCLPMLIQIPILFSLIFVIAKPLTYMYNVSSSVTATLIQEYSKLDIPNKITYVYYKQMGAAQYVHQLMPNLNIQNVKMNLFGLLDLSRQPSWKWADLTGPNAGQYWALLILVIAAVATTFLSSKLSMSVNKQTQGTNNAAAGMTNSMLYVGPIITLMFAFQFPAALAVYWLTGYVFQIFQQLYINKVVLKKKEVAKPNVK